MSAYTLWSDFAAAGGVPIGALEVVRASIADDLTDDTSCDLTIVDDARVETTLRRVVRIDDAVLGVREFRIQSRGRTFGQGLRRVTGIGPLADLATAGLVRTVRGVGYALGEIDGEPSG